MSLTQGKTDLRILRTRPKFLDEAAIQKLKESLATNSFKGFSSNTAPEASGLIPLMDTYETSFDNHNLWLTDDRDIVALGLRVDKKRVPGALLKRRVHQACEAWRSERGVEKVPRVIVKEIQERLKDELIQKAFPSTQIFSVLWFPARGEVWVDTIADGKIDVVRKTLHRIGVTAIPQSPLDLVQDGSAQATLMSSTLEDMPKVSTDKDPEFHDDVTSSPPHLAHAFLAWLWLQVEERGASVVPNPASEPIRVWIEPRLGLRHPSSAKITTLITSEQPEQTAEAKAALRSGEWVEDLRLGFARADREYAVTLSGSSLLRKGLQIPGGDFDADPLTALYDRTLMIEDAENVLRDLYKAFTVELLEKGIRRFSVEIESLQAEAV